MKRANQWRGCSDLVYAPIIKDDVMNNAKTYFVILVIFIVGIFLGVMFVNQINDKSQLEQYINTYIDETKSSENVDYFKELEKDLNSNNIAIKIVTIVIVIIILIFVVIFAYNYFSLGLF